MFPRLIRLCLGFVLAAGLGSGAAAATVTVFAAASLKTALDEIGAAFTSETGHRVVASYAGSSVLARQIELGAPADIFISAHPAWMDRLQELGLIDPATRSDLLANRLVLIAHGPADPTELTPGFDLAARLGDGRLAMALVDAVPAGVYGKAALEHLGLWASVAPRVAQADNVRAALALVALGEAPLGIVYATDALVDPRVSLIGDFPPDSHPPIRYPIASVAGTGDPSARAFLAYLTGPSARAVFDRLGFTRPGG